MKKLLLTLICRIIIVINIIASYSVKLLENSIKKLRYNTITIVFMINPLPAGVCQINLFVHTVADCIQFPIQYILHEQA